MTLDSPVTEVKGVGPEVAKKLATLGIHSVFDLIDYYPRRYDDYSHIQPIARIKPGVVTIKAVIKQAKGRYARRGLHITEAVASDETDSVRLIWFNQPYRAGALKADTEYYISGEFGLRASRLSILNPSVELVSDFPINTARIIPVYRETKGLKSTQIRRAIRSVSAIIENLEETLPGWVIKEQKLMSRANAIMQMHFPGGAEQLAAARRRLGFEEVFGLSLAALMNKYELLTEHAVSIPFKQDLAREFVSHLPFTLTDDQRKAIWQIYQDIEKLQPMNRLIEGDVGSGKTVVAAMAALMALEQGYQVALMAPTELLARQHAETIYALLEPLGFADQVGLLVGSLSAAQKKTMYGSIQQGTVRFIVGTHALIQEKVDIQRLGLVIIDEQHRFGVEQRKELQAKAGHAVHVLAMTATPIPRSLALTLYGELDISVIRHKPEGRKPVLTKIVSPNSRKQLYEKIDLQLAAGRQMFVVCPLITPTAQAGEEDTTGWADVLSVEQAFAAMNKAFGNYKVGLLHGKLKAAEKEAIMQQYVSHELDILVSTTVIEVGVNVPNATVMLIENAERFGLAQVHQLRGRVGRSEHQGYCFLMLGAGVQPSRRLRALESSSDGFKLAELDLEIRGPGAIYGTMQHGQLDLRVAQLSDTPLIASARQTAQKFIDKPDDLLKYKELAARVQRLRAVTNLN